jgi:hypothetical protein
MKRDKYTPIGIDHGPELGRCFMCCVQTDKGGKSLKGLLNMRLRQSDGQKFSYPFGVVHGTDSHEIISKTLDKYTKRQLHQLVHTEFIGSVEQRIHIPPLAPSRSMRGV